MMISQNFSKEDGDFFECLHSFSKHTVEVFIKNSVNFLKANLLRRAFVILMRGHTCQKEKESCEGCCSHAVINQQKKSS